MNVIKKYIEKKLFLIFLSGLICGLFILTLTNTKELSYFGKYEPLNNNSYSDIVEKAIPSVVSIYSKRITPSLKVPNNKLPFNSIFGRNQSKVETMLGSGVIFSSDGYVLTNLHVIGSNNISAIIELSDGRKIEAKIIGVDVGTDLAVLKIESVKDLPSLEIGNSDILKVGDIALAIGNPYGIGKSVSLGIISATGREFNNPYSNYIQTDAAINKGNSGGALVNSKGKLIGINTFIRSSSGGSEGIGLAIPSLTALRIFSDLVKFGEVRRGWLGFNIDPNLLRSSGILSINFIHPNSPAEKGTLKKGDIILQINNQTSSYEDLFREFVRLKPGGEIKLQINRSGQIINLNFFAESQPN